MSFTTGVYLVYHQNPQNKEYYLVGRDFYETPVNLDPKPLYNKIDNAEPWIIEALPNKHYKMYVKEAPSGILVDGSTKTLVAFLTGQNRAQEWSVTAIQGQKDIYTVHNDKNEGWIVTDPGNKSKVTLQTIEAGDARFYFKIEPFVYKP